MDVLGKRKTREQGYVSEDALSLARVDSLGQDMSDAIGQNDWNHC